MNETLLDKAIKNYNVAVMIYNSMEGDESYLNYIGYHLQQAVKVEKALNGVDEYLDILQKAESAPEESEDGEGDI